MPRRARPEDILAGHAPAVVETAERLRALVRRVVPDAEERAYPGWRGIGYRHPVAGYFAGVFPREDHVRLLFEHGARLPDADGVLTGDGSRTRYVVVRPGEPVPEKAIGRLLLLAVAR